MDPTNPAPPFPPFLTCPLPLPLLTCPPTWPLRLLLDLQLSPSWDTLNTHCACRTPPLSPVSAPLPAYLAPSLALTGTPLALPLCVLTSFFKAALLTAHSAAFMGVLLALVGAFVTTTWLESRRAAAQGAGWVVRWPVATWMLAQVVTAGVVLGQVQMPGCIARGRVLRGRVTRNPGPGGIPAAGLLGRGLVGGEREVYALAAAVAVGYFLPTALMLTAPPASGFATAVVILWQFFPVGVEVLRRSILRQTSPGPAAETGTYHPESHPRALLSLYALPCLFSLLTHLNLVRTTFWPRTGGEGELRLTRDAIGVLVLDFWLVVGSALVWLGREGGWRGVGAAVGVGVLAGPGAGVCVGWVVREGWILREVGEGEGSGGKDGVVLVGGGEGEGQREKAGVLHVVDE